MRLFRNRSANAIARARHVHCQPLEPRLLLSTLPPGFAETQIANHLQSATAMTVAPDGRVFIALQGGDVRIVQNGKLLPTPFLSISTSYGNASQGVMGITLDPKFESNGFVYIDYTVGGSTAYQRISRFTANGNVAVAGSEDVLFQVGPQTSAGHIGGGLEFGADGKLYFTYGDQQRPDFATIGTQLNNFYGKMIRINPDGTIPTDNPFYNKTTGIYRAIYAIGLRNAFSFSVQPTTGLIYIADVGASAYEEIDKGIPGANYGWPSSEGPTTIAGQTSPVYAYKHTGAATGAYSVTSGPFYDPAVDQFPSQYVGKYFFGDWGTGNIQTLDPANPSTAKMFATGAFDTVALSVGPDGSLYYLTRGDNNYGLDSPNGQLFQIKYTGVQSPSIAVQPANLTAAVGSSATFSFETNGAGPFTYQWQSGGMDIPGANSPTYTVNNVDDSDDAKTFDVVVTNAFGAATSDPATLSIIPHAPPAVTLVSPAPRSFYTAGKSLSFSATATDPAFGTLPGSDFAWTITFYHSTSVATVMTLSGKTSGSYLIPTTALNDADVHYRVTLTVIDPDGLATSAFQDVFPNASIETLAANVPGAQLTLDGNTVTTPYSFLSVTGTKHTIAAAAQTVAGTAYNFTSWSDGGAASHAISTPTSNTTYTAKLTATTTTTQTTLIASGDSYIRDGSYANTNYGSSSQLQVKAGTSGYNRYALITFNLASLKTISAANLMLFGQLSDSTNSGIATSVYAVTGTWSESKVTYNTRPAASTTSLASFSVSGTTGKWYTVNLTAWLKQLKAAGATSASFMLKNSSATSAYTIFNSKESGGNGPRLIVTP